MAEVWNGIDVDVWGPIQTLAPKTMQVMFYSGYEQIGLMDDLVEKIPLDIRYANFKRRLTAALDPKSKQR